MKTTKVLLYCTKATPYLVKDDYTFENEPVYFTHYKEPGSCGLPLNGKIVVECEVETETRLNYGLERRSEFILENTGLTMEQLDAYLPKHKEYDSEDVYYALHIKNLKELRTPLTFEKNCIYKAPQGFKQVLKAPQSMMRVYDRFGNKYILISIRPEWLCKILNGEKTIEVRKKVLKEML